MWSTLLLINSILFVIGSFFLVYFFGAMILLLQWKPFILTLIVCVFLGFAEIALAAISEP